MKRINILIAIAALACSAGAATNRPNVVFIMADDLGWGSLSCYGGKVETPNCDQLAAEGLRFTDAHTPAACCTPTRYGLLTGRYAWRTRLKKSVLFSPDHSLIEPNRFTLADLFKQAGYRTGIVGKWHLGTQSKTPVDYNKPLRPGPNELGFDYWFGIPNSHNLPPFVYVRNGEVVGRKPGEKIIFKPNNLVKNPKDVSTISEKRIHEKMGPRLAQEACDFIRREHKNPFFLYFPTGTPHSPITPCKEVQGTSGHGKYGDFIKQFDWMIGNVVKTLKECGVYNNTLIIVTSDNGGQERFASDIKWPINGPWRGQKSMAYEGGHRVPFIARWPGVIPANKTSAAPLSLVDMTATFSALYDIELPENSAPDSLNVLPALLGTKEKDLHNYMIFHSTRGTFAVRQGDWKLIDGPDGGGYEHAEEGAPPVQLFNLKDDPKEETNLWQKHPEKVQKLKHLLETERKRNV